MDFVGHAWRMASAWRLRLHDGRSFERDRHGLMVLLAHVFVRSLEASLDAMGVVLTARCLSGFAACRVSCHMLCVTRANTHCGNAITRLEPHEVRRKRKEAAGAADLGI